MEIINNDGHLDFSKEELDILVESVTSARNQLRIQENSEKNHLHLYRQEYSSDVKKPCKLTMPRQIDHLDGSNSSSYSSSSSCSSSSSSSGVISEESINGGFDSNFQPQQNNASSRLNYLKCNAVNSKFKFNHEFSETFRVDEERNRNQSRNHLTQPKSTSFEPTRLRSSSRKKNRPPVMMRRLKENEKTMKSSSNGRNIENNNTRTKLIECSKKSCSARQQQQQQQTKLPGPKITNYCEETVLKDRMNIKVENNDVVVKKKFYPPFGNNRKILNTSSSTTSLPFPTENKIISPISKQQQQLQSKQLMINDLDLVENELQLMDTNRIHLLIAETLLLMISCSNITSRLENLDNESCFVLGNKSNRNKISSRLQNKQTTKTTMTMTTMTTTTTKKALRQGKEAEQEAILNFDSPAMTNNDDDVDDENESSSISIPFREKLDPICRICRRPWRKKSRIMLEIPNIEDPFLFIDNLYDQVLANRDGNNDAEKLNNSPVISSSDEMTGRRRRCRRRRYYTRIKKLIKKLKKKLICLILFKTS